MKNAKKLLLFVFALVALVLVMSVTAFAATYEVNSESTFSSALSNAADGDTLLVTDNFELHKNNGWGTRYSISKGITIDLNGFTIYTYQNQGSIDLQHPDCAIVSNKVENGKIVRGTIEHKVGVAVLRGKYAAKLENINLVANRGEGKDFVLPDTNGAGGISIRGAGACITLIKNVTISGPNLSYGIETSGCGNTTTPVVTEMEGVEIIAKRDGVVVSAPLGTATNCKISGAVAGVKFTTPGEGGSVGISLVNSVVASEGNAVVIVDTGVGTMNLVADKASDLVSSGDIFNISTSDSTNLSFDIVGYTKNSDGSLTACSHADVKAGSCTVRSECLICTKLLNYVHNYVESARVDSTCVVNGSATYTCSLCADSYTETLKLADHSYSSVVTKPTCEADGYTTYTCATCGDTYTEAGETATGHNYVETDRVDATEGANGYIEYTCNNCSGTKREELVYCSHNYVVVEKVDVSCLNAGYAKYECSLCGETKEETTEKEAHTYDWKIAGCPKCNTVAIPDTEGGKVSTNLGYTVYFAASWQEIANNVSASSTYDVIRLTADSTASSYAQVKNKNILIDLGGHTITTSVDLASIYLYQAKGLVNGTLVHGGKRQGLVCYNVDFIEDVTINVTATLDKNATGMIVFSNAAYGKSYVGSMKNVTIMGNIPNHGLELQNADTVVGSMTNVKIYSKGQAITTKANIGTMTNCVFSGDNVGLAIAQINGTFELVNCEIYGGNLAIQITGAVAGSNPAFVFGSDTKFITSGVIFDIADDVEGNPDYDFSAITSTVALVNGQLYTSIDDAFNALINSTEELTTFALMQDVEIDSPIVINKKVNFSLGGGTYKIPIYGTSNFDEVTVDGYKISAPNGLFEVVEGGSLTLSGDGYVLGNEATVVVNGGTVVVDGGTYYGYNPSDYVVDGYHALYNEENDSYTIGKHDYDYIYGNTFNDGECDCGYVRGIARIGETFYMTFEEAFAAAKSGDTIYLLDTAVITKDEAYDLTGLTIHAFGDAFEVQSGATLTLNGDGRVNAGQSGVGSWCAIWANGGHVIINGGTYSVKGDATEGVDPNHQNDLIYTKNGGTVTINGGTFKYTEGVWALNQNDKTGGAIVVYGGTFEGFDPANNASEGANTSFLADGYHSIANNNVYTVGAHNVVIDASKDATCTETGLTEGSHCSICGEIFVEQEVIDVKEHNYVAGEQAEDGSVTYTCVNGCEDAYVINNKLLNGTYYADASASFIFDNGTLTANGETFNYTFNVTTQTLSVEGLPEGEIAYVGGNIIYRGRVQLHQHFEENYIKEVTNPTCTSKGYTTYICQICGPLFTADEVEPLDHSYNAVVTDPTCTENGFTTYTCTVCGDTYTDNVVDATGHTYGDPVYDDIGYTVTCTACGDAIFTRVAGTTQLPFDATIGDNTNNYGTEETFWQFAVAENGTVTITMPSADISFMAGLNPRAMTNCTGSTSYEFEVTAYSTLYLAINACETESYTFGLAFKGEEKVYVTEGEDAAVNVTVENNFCAGTTVYFKSENGGTYVITLVDGELNASITDITNDSYIEEYPYEFTLAAGEEIMLIVATDDVMNLTEDTINFVISEKPSHVCDTAVEIPATFGYKLDGVVYPGMTSGAKCSVCGKTTITPVEASSGFEIPTASLTLSQDINVKYTVNIPAGYSNVYATFKLIDVDTSELVYVYEENADTSKDRTVEFLYNGLKFYYMNELIEARIYATNEDGRTVAFENNVMSVAYYSTRLLNAYASYVANGNPAAIKLCTLISDLLIAGDMTQIYEGYETDNLVSVAVKAKGAVLTPSTSSLDDVTIPQSAFTFENNEAGKDIRWSGASLSIGQSTYMKLSFNAADIEGLTVKITIGSYDPIYVNASDLGEPNSKGQYTVELKNIRAKEYGVTIKAEFLKDGEAIENGAVIYSSINTYLYNMRNNSNVNIKNLVRALYNYGAAVYAYEN